MTHPLTVARSAGARRSTQPGTEALIITPDEPFWGDFPQVRFQ